MYNVERALHGEDRLILTDRAQFDLVFGFQDADG